jgi:pimeloyl-ACP methyl ester carboxylesterase
MPAPVLDQVLSLPDGRRLGFDEYGAPDGLPVFFFHGTPGSRREGSVFHELCAARGLRLICPDRPGMGLSDFQPDRRLVQWPEDLAALADHLGCRRFAVMGVSGGGPYALAAAHALPDRVKVAAFVSGIGPTTEPEALAGLSTVERLSFASVRVPGLVRAFAGLYRMAFVPHYEWLLARSMPGTPEADRRVLARPEIRAALAADVREAFRQGSRGMAHDEQVFLSPWGFRVEDVRVPVLLWHGTADRNAAPALARFVAERLPDCRAEFFPDEGHLFVFLRAPELLDAVAARAAD